MRVIAGRAKGRRLLAPKGVGTRPTSDAVREAIFNSLQSVIDLDGAAVADLFAGSGAMGIEALSRGAATCTFVENDRAAAEVIRANLAATGLAAGGATVRQGDAGKGVPGEFDVVFADPPYAFDGWTDVAGGLDTTVFVAESDRPVELGEPWRLVRSKRYGATVVSLFTSQE